jgi:putative acetyltransferase
MIEPPILRAAALADVDLVRALFREYHAWLGQDLCFQGFEAELASLPGRYAPPSGRLVVAEMAGQAVGCVGLRDLGQGICEMKRLYVRDPGRGRGVGRALAERVIAEARGQGYRAMRLDTLRTEQMAAANGLYDHLGFRDIPAYYDNPLPGVRYMELSLSGG